MESEEDEIINSEVELLLYDLKLTADAAQSESLQSITDEIYLESTLLNRLVPMIASNVQYRNNLEGFLLNKQFEMHKQKLEELQREHAAMLNLELGATASIVHPDLGFESD
jgi:hypothetical protein